LRTTTATAATEAEPDHPVSRSPILALIELSTSFRHAWRDLANELGVEIVSLQVGDQVPDRAMLIAVNAGGEEDRALDVLTLIPRTETTPVYLIGGNPSHRFAVEALRRGATDYFALPDDADVLRRTVQTRVDTARESTPQPRQRTDDPFTTIHGESPVLVRVLDAARRVVSHEGVTVLIRGETGTGKELLARALHDGSPRSTGPFVAVNCAAIPAQLMESELFGHERGAFTDAHAAKPGLFEEAHRGTLFLDEIGHLPLELQGKLLRALEDRRIRRVGGTQSRELDVRIIAATNVDLADAVGRGAFREDLYYRLNVVVLLLPPLRERGDDIVTLAERFATELAGRYDLPVPTLDAATAVALERYAWPGNVRELRHAVERSLLLSSPGQLEPEHLTPTDTIGVRRSEGPIPFPATMDTIQVAAAEAALLRHEGNKTAAARQLGISRARLQRLLDRRDESDA